MILNRYERAIAKRYLLPTKGEGFIFVVAGFSVGAVALGVAALIIVMGVMNGFRAELFDKIVGLNLLSPLLLCQAARRVMTSGSIVNISSVSALRPSPGTAAYGAAKAGLDSLTRTLAVEWAPL